MTLSRSITLATIAAMALSRAQLAAADENPLANSLEVPGAATTLPVNAAKEPWPFDFAKDARARFDNFHYQLGGDHALYYNQNLSEFLPTAYSSPYPTYMPLEVALDERIGGAVKFTTKEGALTLDEYVVHPNHRVQGVLMIHKGKIVYQACRLRAAPKLSAPAPNTEA